MGLGDQLMATGMARGARSRRMRIAFGDGRRILWDKSSGEIFRGNPNIAPPGDERARDIKWVRYYKGHRIYNTQDIAANRWIWNLDFHAQPGEMFFGEGEKRTGARFGGGFILIEPNVEGWKSCAPNKDWGRTKYQRLTDRLRDDGYRLAQFSYPRAGAPLEGVEVFPTTSFRDALAILSHAKLYIGPEGGLHHGAAAVGIPAVVLFGGFIPPSVTGYESHTNLTGGAEACGSLSACPHCRAAMRRVSVEEVYSAARDYV